MKGLTRIVQCRFRKAYWTHTEDLIQEDTAGNPGTKKTFWTYTKAKKTETAGVSPIKVDGKLVTDAKGTAEVPNNQFQPEDLLHSAEFEARTKLTTNKDGPTVSYTHLTLPTIVGV